ncbi:MAG: HAD-IA family hydrolase [Actinomycetota bacterium]|nr:HAD-IA family hydrolase [Actinomycetota bacterium]
MTDSAYQDKQVVSSEEYGAWLFDLDGVITDTAGVHAAAWKRMFDGYLKEVSEREGRPLEPFEIDPDYYRYVDGKPRYDGVDSFLRSRGIVLKRGNPDDALTRETVCGLGNRKNAIFNEVLRLQGVEVFGSSVALIRELRSRDRRVAVVTSSKNCDAVLEAAGISDLLDARVDGNIAAEKQLAGKPASETYEEAARMLATPPERAVVIEDAVSGIRAGRGGGFGLVIGVARHDDPGSLRKSGADVVVCDLAELSLV